MGDTLHISYIDSVIPYACIKNRTYNEIELNYDYIFMNRIHKPSDYSLYGVSTTPILYTKKGMPVKEQIPRIETDAKNLLIRELKFELNYLDSLKNENLLSDYHHAYRKYNVLSTVFMLKLDTLPDNCYFSADSLFLKYDSLICFGSYRRFILNRIWNLAHTNSDIPYTQTQFDEIIYSSNYSNNIKRYVIRLIAEDMREHIQNDDLKKVMA
jgi:hypothetical protein